DVAEHVFCDEHIEIPGTADKVERLRIDVVVARADVGKERAPLVEDLAEKGVGAEDVRLVDAGNVPLRWIARFAPPGDPEGGVTELFRRGACDAQSLARLAVADDLAAPLRIEK